MPLKRALMLNLQPPLPPYDGGGLRTIAALDALSSILDATFLSICSSEEELSEASHHLKAYCHTVELIDKSSSDQRLSYSYNRFKEMIVYPPLRITKFLNLAYIQRVSALLERQFDLIVCNTILCGQVLLQPTIAAKTKATPKILDMVDVFELTRRRETRLARGMGVTRLSRFVDWQKTAAYEKNIWKLFDGIIAISNNDAVSAKRSSYKTPIAIIPTPIALPPTANNEENQKDFDLLMVGSLEYSPNVDAIAYFDSQILPLLLQEKPELRVAIVGKNPVPRVLEIVKRLSCYDLFPNVPEVTTYYQRSRIVIIPMRAGSGIKVKLLEAMAQGVAIVTTSIGAFGVPVEDNTHVLIADIPDKFARQALALLKNPGYARQLASNSLRLIKEYYTVPQFKQNYIEFVSNFLSGKSS